MYLTDFEKLLPLYSYEQEESLHVLARLHASTENGREVQERIAKVCCRPNKIGRRGTSITEEWFGEKRDFGERCRLFQLRAEEAFKKFYPVGAESPDDLIHVTCTGYHSPSAAQKIVLEREWTKKTMVTHAYHMGCMAALPAIRIALGYSLLGKRRTDLVHTEFCSLHINPELHEDEQLVAQSLFADGLIKYSLYPGKVQKKGFTILTVYEELIPGTEALMEWACENWGMKMTLSKQIPFKIAHAIPSFITKLERRCGFPLTDAFYAIHPGGPKIIELIGKKLNLFPKQLEDSEQILYQYGNMSSATLPHILESMLDRDSIPNHSRCVALAFGPGVCITGMVLRKEVS